MILSSESRAGGQGSLSRAARMQAHISEGKFRFASIQAFFTASVIKPLSTILTLTSKMPEIPRTGDLTFIDTFLLNLGASGPRPDRALRGTGGSLYLLPDIPEPGKRIPLLSLARRFSARISR
jgi:hypothetical protein